MKTAKKQPRKTSMVHKIKVSDAHIAKGVPEDYNSCPIALALKEHFGHNAYVDLEDAEGGNVVPFIGIYAGGVFQRLVVRNPDKVKEFIMKFDNGRKVKSFYLSIED